MTDKEIPTTYDELRKRQQHLVDELARERVENLNRTYEEIAEAAAEGTDYDPYTPGYVGTIKDEYADVIDERVQILANKDVSNGEADGEMTVTVGNKSYTGPAEGLNLAGDETPNTAEEAREFRRMLASADTADTNDANAEAQAEAEDGEVTVSLSHADALAIIRAGDVPERVAKIIFAAVAE